MTLQNQYRRYMAEILPIRRKAPFNRTHKVNPLGLKRRAGRNYTSLKHKAIDQWGHCYAFWNKGKPALIPVLQVFRLIFLYQIWNFNNSSVNDNVDECFSYCVFMSMSLHCVARLSLTRIKRFNGIMAYILFPNLL